MTPEQLKTSILQKAICGKLVEQRVEEDKVEKLLSFIKSKKEEKIQNGELKAEKPLPDIKEEDIPFDIPDSWKWVRLGDYCEKVTDQVASGSFASLRENVPSLKEPNYAIMVKTADFANGFSTNLTYTTEQGYNFLSNSNLFGGELMLSNIGSIGRCFIVPDLGTKMTLAPNAIMLKLIDNSYRDYLYYFILSRQGYNELLEISSGTTMKKFNKTDLKKILIPIPPLEEQHRIVSKIEELLPYVECYAEVYEKLKQFNTKFPEDMKKSILQYAIQGKLVEQRPEEGTAEELYQQIQNEKQRLIKEGKMKKEKPLPEITEDEIPFDIPKSWKWVRVGNIGSWGSGATPSRTHSEYYGGDIPWLKTGDLNDGYIDGVSECITELALEKTSVRLNPVGSVLMAMYGATIGKLGILNIQATTNQACCACIPFSGMSNKYLFFYLLATRHMYIGMAEGGAQPNISKEKIINSIIPLPPLEEQHRIVAKIEELLPYCDKLANKK